MQKMIFGFLSPKTNRFFKLNNVIKEQDIQFSLEHFRDLIYKVKSKEKLEYRYEFKIWNTVKGNYREFYKQIFQTEQEYDVESYDLGMFQIVEELVESESETKSFKVNQRLKIEYEEEIKNIHNSKPLLNYIKLEIGEYN